MSSAYSDDDDFDGGFIEKFIICAPKEQVYDAFIDHIWYKNNYSFGVVPHKLIQTQSSKDFNIQYPQKSIGCKSVLETIYSAKYNQFIKYKVESYFLPTIKYHATIEFKDYYDSQQEFQCCLLIWSAQFNFRCKSCNYCCPFMAVAFRKIMQYFVYLMGKSLKTFVEEKKQK